MQKTLTATVAALMLGLLGCASFPARTFTPEQTVYIDRVMKQPLEFDIPKAESVDAWARAQVFIGKYASMKLQVVADNVMETYNAPAGAGFPTVYDCFKYGYGATRLPLGDKVRMTVRCNNGCPNAFRGKTMTLGADPFALGDRNAEINAHALADFILTGQEPVVGIVAQ